MPPKKLVAFTTTTILLVVFIPFMVAYLLSELYRNINSVVGPIIKTELGLSIEYLGLITSVFLATVATAQIFTGIWLDKYGPRKTVASLLIIGATGAVLFATATPSDAFHWKLLGGRVLIGLGMAGCWTAAFMINSRWLPAERLALANGAIVGFAGLGALFSTLPTQLLLTYISWRELFLWLSAVTVAVSALIFIVVPPHPNDAMHDRSATLAQQLRGFYAVCTHPDFLRFAPISALGQGVWIAYQGLWAGVWLREVDNLPPIPVATILLLFAATVVVGNLASGVIADAFARRKISVATIMTAMSLVFIGVQIIIVLNFQFAQALLWSLFGLLVSSSLFAYTLIARAVPSPLVGRAMSLLNLLATLCAFLMQYGVGALIEFWSPLADGGYPAAAHQTAFGIIILCQIIGFWWLVNAPRWLKNQR